MNTELDTNVTWRRLDAWWEMPVSCWFCAHPSPGSSQLQHTPKLHVWLCLCVYFTSLFSLQNSVYVVWPVSPLPSLGSYLSSWFYGPHLPYQLVKVTKGHLCLKPLESANTGLFFSASVTWRVQVQIWGHFETKDADTYAKFVPTPYERCC